MNYFTMKFLYLFILYGIQSRYFQLQNLKAVGSERVITQRVYSLPFFLLLVSALLDTELGINIIQFLWYNP